MRVNDLLANREKYVDQVVELEGSLYIKQHYMKEWYFLDTMSLSNIPLPIKRTESGVDRYVPSSDLTDFLDLRFGLYRKDNATFILNDIILTGKVTADESQLLIFSKNIEKIVFPVPNFSNIVFYVKNNIQFHDAPLHDDTITPVLALRDHLNFYMGKYIRVEGILRGDTRPEETSWIASPDNGDANERLDETQFPLLLEQKGILEEIIHQRVGGEFAYWDKVQAMGRIAESNQPPFVAMLTDMTHLLIKLDERCIVVHRFD